MTTAQITLGNSRQADAAFRSDEQARSAAAAKLIGLALATLVPALFWTGMTWAIGHACGIEITTNSLVVIAVTITLFLSFVCSALLSTD